MKTIELFDMLLNEAYRFNNGQEVIDGIKNKQLGIKIPPEYKDFNNAKLFDNFINKANQLNLNQEITWGLQFLISKVKPEDLNKAIVNDAIYEMMKDHKKEWAKPIINNIKEYDNNEWHSIEKQLQDESQNHGKHKKGSGNTKDVKNLYDDGTWTLQVPTSFEGEKAIAYFGKRGEKQIPTHWCTRADENYYKMYSNSSPLYVIRNWKTGKAYQVAFDNYEVHFLDQMDKKGDEITKGDLEPIPDELLSKIEWKGRTLADYKKSYNLANKKANEALLSKKGQFKNGTNSVEKAVWGKPIKVNDKISKQIWTNYVSRYNDDKKSNMNKYMNDREEVKIPVYRHEGDWAAKYYFNDNPDKYVVCNVDKGWGNHFYIDFKNSVHGISLTDDEIKELRRCARDDFGMTRNHKRTFDKEESEHNTFGIRINDNYFKKSLSQMNKSLKKIVVPKLQKLFDKYGTTVELIVYLYNNDGYDENKSRTAIIPYSLLLKYRNRDKDLVPLAIYARRSEFKKDKSKFIRYEKKSDYGRSDYEHFAEDYGDKIKDKKELDELEANVLKTINDNMKYAVKDSLKNRDLNTARVYEKSLPKPFNVLSNLYYEDVNYFEY